MPSIDEIISLKSSDRINRKAAATEALSRLLKQYPSVIAAAGNIGYGKTAVTTLLRSSGVVSFNERVEDPMLTDFYYVNRRRYSAIFQVHVGGKRSLHQWLAIQKAVTEGISCASDRSGYEEPLTFIPALHKMGDLTEKQKEDLMIYFDLQFKEGAKAKTRYKELYALIKANPDPSPDLLREFSSQVGIGSPPPDILVFLHGDRQIAWERQKLRDAEYEKVGKGKHSGLPEPLHINLHEEYEHLEENLRKTKWYTGPIVKLDQNKVNIAETTGEIYLLEALVETLARRSLESRL